MTYTLNAKPLRAALMCAAIAAFGLTACANSDVSTSDAVVSEMKTQMTSQPQGSNGYLKPGAAVRFAHTYDGKSNPGDIENFTITLSDAYDDGTLNLEIQEQDGLTYYNSTRSYSFPMSGNADHSLDLQIGTPVAGKKLLNLFVDVQTADGQTIGRSFAIAFYVGGEKALKSDGSAIQDSMPVAMGGVIVMDAQEEIIRP